MKLCLDSLTVTDTEPADLIRAAGSAGFDYASLWVQAPSLFPRQLLTPGKASACRAALAETGIQAGPLEVFDLRSAEAVASYRPALELGAQLGSRSASAINVLNPDPVLVADLFARFAELAGEYGLAVTLEPLATFATATLAQACDIIRASGVDAGIVLDAFHLVREGGTAADVRAMAPGLIRYVQLCDGALSAAPDVTRHEASCERQYPGDGAFPLVELLRDAPVGITWGIEAPSVHRAQSGMSAATQAREAMASVRRTIQRIAAAR